MSQFEMKKVETLPDFIQLEHQMLKFWASNQIFNKLRQKNAAGEIFRFLDGPITANNPMGVHHARGRTLKDTFLRYKSLRGYTSHYQNGFDGQGLWVEVEVERELGFNSKEDIIAYGIKEFIQRCKERVEKYSAIQTEQSVRLGQWMDWPNSYYTHHDSNIEGIWYFLGKCHHNGWLYKSHRPMRWCPRCGTSLSEHEMIGSYRDIVHVSVYALAPSKSQEFSLDHYSMDTCREYCSGSKTRV
jgi:isoleucyl-tRNA synthetase